MTLDFRLGMDLKSKLWSEGWTFHQRIKFAKEYNCKPVNLESSTLKLWEKAIAPYEKSNFAKRLAWDNLTQAQASWVLEANCPSSEPYWWSTLVEIRKASGFPVNSKSTRSDEFPFVHAWRPVASWALSKLKESCSDLNPLLSLSSVAWNNLSDNLLEKLCNVGDQALWSLFNQYRTPGELFLARIVAQDAGETNAPCTAYAKFINSLLNSQYEQLLQEYPVLGRLLAISVDQWLESTKIMLRRIAENRLLLMQHYDISTQSVLSSIQLGLSDPHKGGQEVAILCFGSDFVEKRVVYKPKDMRVDRAFQDFLSNLSRASSLPPLREVAVQCCNGYGFMEWVMHEPCQTDRELATFYWNAGRLLAILYLLGCSDCHYENLIASKTNLILIDHETLLEADLSVSVDGDSINSEPISSLRSAIQSSVLRTGLLPQWQTSGANRKWAYDVSALGIRPRPSNREQPGWLAINSDAMMAGIRLEACEPLANLPLGLGTEPRLYDFSEVLCVGFTEQLREAIRLRQTFHESINTFMGKPRRLVSRPTRIYYAIQRQMLEPTSLRSAVAHGLKLEQLSRSYLQSSQMPVYWGMFLAETRQMEQLDIPFFEHLIDSDLISFDDETQSFPGYIRTDGISAARKRVERLDESEISFQKQLIIGSITARHVFSKPLDELRNLSTDELRLISTGGDKGLDFSDVVRNEALRLGEELWSAAIFDREGRPEWLGLDLGADGESFHFGMVGPFLYSGTSGIALAFTKIAAHLEAIGNRNDAHIWRHRACACMEAIAFLAFRDREKFSSWLSRSCTLGLSGIGGLLLCLEILKGQGIHDAAKLAEVTRKSLARSKLISDENIDIIGGVAGLIGPLLLSGDAYACSLAETCGERLLSLQLDCGGWASGRASRARMSRPLTGFSHGASGIASSLIMLAKASGSNKYLNAARRAIDYERSVYDSRQKNWPDFRSSDSSNIFMLSWCHGAPGILLSRLIAKSSDLYSSAIAAEVISSYESTLTALETQSRINDPSAHVCCGILGLTTILRMYSEKEGSSLPEIVPMAELALISNASLDGEYRLFSVEGGSVSMPGLFTGKSGIILALLEACGGQAWLPLVLSAGLFRC